MLGWGGGGGCVRAALRLGKVGLRPRFLATTPTPAHEFNQDRASWRREVSKLRKQYAEEQRARVEEQAARKKEQQQELKRRKAERLQQRLKRSAENRRLAEARRLDAIERYEANRLETDAHRKEKEALSQRRHLTLLEHLELESKEWLTPERVDEEVVDSFFENPGICGSFRGRSPYWGFVAEVEDPLEVEASMPFSPAPRSREEATALATHLMRSYSENYRAFKNMRENTEEIEEFISFLQEVQLEDSTPRIGGSIQDENSLDSGADDTDELDLASEDKE